MIERGVCMGGLSYAHRTSERRVGGACKMRVYSRAVERKGTRVSLKTDSLSSKLACVIPTITCTRQDWPHVQCVYFSAWPPFPLTLVTGYHFASVCSVLAPPLAFGPQAGPVTRAADASVPLSVWGGSSIITEGVFFFIVWDFCRMVGLSRTKWTAECTTPDLIVRSHPTDISSRPPLLPPVVWLA